MKSRLILMCLGLFVVCASLQAQETRFAYVANFFSGSVSVYTIDPTTGALAFASVAATGSQPTTVAVDPTGRFAYVGNSAENGGVPSISAYAIDPNTGALTELAGAPFPTGLPPGPNGITVHPSGKFLYVANDIASSNNSFVSAFRIDAKSGTLSQIPGSPYPTGINTWSVTTDPAGKFLFVANGGSNNVLAYSIDTNNGTLTPIPGSPFPAGINTLQGAVDPKGHFLYVTNSSSNSITAYSIDANTGALTSTPHSPFPAGSFDVGVVIDPTGHFLYTGNVFSDNISAYSIDANTGDLTPLAGSPFPAGSQPYHLTIDPTGTYLYATNRGSSNVSAYTINATTGALTPVPGSPFPTGTGPQWVAVASEAASTTLTIQPTTGGNTGSVTVRINGSGFQSGAQVKLTGLGPDIIATNTNPLSVTTLTATFDLTNAQPGLRDVIVTNPDDSTLTLSQGFTIEQGGAPQIWVDIVGPDKIRIGREQTYYIVYGNSGNVDSPLALFEFGDILNDVSVRLPSSLSAPPPAPGQSPIDLSDFPSSYEIENGGTVHIPLASYPPAGSATPIGAVLSTATNAAFLTVVLSDRPQVVPRK